MSNDSKMAWLIAVAKMARHRVNENIIFNIMYRMDWVPKTLPPYVSLRRLSPARNTCCHNEQGNYCEHLAKKYLSDEEFNSIPFRRTGDIRGYAEYCLTHKETYYGAWEMESHKKQGCIMVEV